MNRKSPKAVPGRSPDAGELIELAERELRLTSYHLESVDRERSSLALSDANVLVEMRKRWGKP